MAKFQINYLGCGSATPTERHLPSCQVIDFRDRLFMVDCGEGSQLQLRRQHLKFSRLNHIFISHLHSDHFLGLPGLLSTLALHAVDTSVTVHTFPQGIELLRRMMNMFCHDTSFALHYEPVDPQGGIVLDERNITVEAFPLYHRVPCVGYIFREKPKERHINGDMIRYLNVPVAAIKDIKGGADYIDPGGRLWPNDRLTSDPDPSASYAYCSDTRFDMRVAEAIRGVDTVYHESTYLSDWEHKAAPRGHSTAAQAGLIASEAGARRLVLGHYSQSYDDDNLFAQEAATTFSGEIIAAHEGMKLDLI